MMNRVIGINSSAQQSIIQLILFLILFFFFLFPFNDDSTKNTEHVALENSIFLK